MVCQGQQVAKRHTETTILFSYQTAFKVSCNVIAFESNCGQTRHGTLLGYLDALNESMLLRVSAVNPSPIAGPPFLSGKVSGFKVLGLFRTKHFIVFFHIDTSPTLDFSRSKRRRVSGRGSELQPRN